jgi:hypothetical protein
MERKYGQRGYQDSDRNEKTDAPKPKRPETEGPRSPKMMAFQGVLRCAMCGANIELIGEVELDRTCAKCGADLRTCRNCTSFDPAARWECRAEIETRVLSKTARTSCEKFVPRRRVEKKTGETSRPAAGNDAKSAFDRLFKK